jgi:hypothetical protein
MEPGFAATSNGFANMACIEDSIANPDYVAMSFGVFPNPIAHRLQDIATGNLLNLPASLVEVEAKALENLRRLMILLSQ